MNWFHVGVNDHRARTLANRHYSRKQPLSPVFCPPGYKIVLIIPQECGASALWVSQRTGDNLDYNPRRDGFDYWSNPYFRNESGIQSSLLIREALAITRFLWRDVPLPDDGFHTFVNPSCVRGVKVHSKTIYGFCFAKAGFWECPQRTKVNGYIRWIMSSADLSKIEPLAPHYEQLSLALP